MAALYSRFVRTFSNVLFAVLLFVIWGLFTLIGVLIAQGKDAAEYFAAYPAPLAHAILRLSFDNVYHSPWYVGIIGLILVSLAVCTFKRVIPARLPPLRAVKVEKIPLNDHIEIAAAAGDVRERVDGFFSGRRWQVRKREFGGTEWTFADKENWARRGVLVAHIGFVIIAAGATLYWARGFEGQTIVGTGQTVEIPQTHALVHLDRFAYSIQPVMTKSGVVYQPTDYVSHVTVTGNDARPKHYVVRVNHPIDVDGTLYYQSSYGFGMRFLVTKDGKRVAASSDPTYQEGDAIAIPGTALTAQFRRFVPTVDRGVPAPDPRVNDPAVVLDLDGGPVLVPLGSSIDLGSGWRIVPQHFVLYSGLQYRNDPGIPLVGIGAFVLLAGLMISFYLLPARLYLQVEDGGPAVSRVGIAATTVKGYDIYEAQFLELVAELRTWLAKPVLEGPPSP